MKYKLQTWATAVILTVMIVLLRMIGREVSIKVIPEVEPE